MTQHDRVIKTVVFGSMKRKYTNYKRKKNKEQEDQRVKDELSKVSQEYAKEIDILNSQLKEANEAIEINNKNKIKMQENLKKAFMRGVCALNLEAMNALNPGEAMDYFTTEPLMQEIPTSNRIPTATELPIMPTLNDNQIEEPQMINIPKIESKDHMWKPAPILAKDFSNITIVRPTTFVPMNTTIPKTEIPMLRVNQPSDNKKDLIIAEGEQEIRCERVPYEGNYIGEGIEARNFAMTKHPVNMYQPTEIPVPMQIPPQPESRIIRVNKYGKSYTDSSVSTGSVSSAKYKPMTNTKKKTTIPHK